jgi:hypothetical protein
MSKANNEKPVLTTQLSIQPNIPSHMILARRDSRKFEMSQKSSPNFPTKTLRMKSLLWVKPKGVAATNLSSTIKQVSLFCALWIDSLVQGPKHSKKHSKQELWNFPLS